MGLSNQLDEKKLLLQDLFRTYKENPDSKTASFTTILHTRYSRSYPITILYRWHCRTTWRIWRYCIYAKIKLIFQHQANNGQYYAFFLFDWFQATKTLDPILKCPLTIFRGLKKHDGYAFFQSTMWIIHFIRACTSARTITKNNETNRRYILNEFYYNLV